MSRTRGALRTVVVVSAVAALAAGCTSKPVTIPGPTSPGATTSSPAPSAWDGVTFAVTPNQAQQALPGARAAWASGPAATGDYQLTVRRSGSAAPVRAVSEVSAGKVTGYDVFTDQRTPGSGPEQLPDAAGTGLPRTVPELMDLVASYEDAAGITVVFDRFGVPARIDVDPNADAVDDEMSLTVSWAGPGALEVPDGSGPWTGPISWTGPYPTQGSNDGIYNGSRAILARDGRGAGVYLTLWGSSTCPAQPTTMTVVEPSEARVGQTQIAAEVLVGPNLPEQRACSMDLAPTTYWVPLPEPYASKLPTSPPALGGPGPLAQLELVLTGDSAVPGGGVWSSPVTAEPRESLPAASS